MRITRLKLKNFIGIKHGMDKDEIEINFPKNGKLITMLNGKNGSGKSTILSQLHPFKESFDDRKTLVDPEKEGIKEIDIESGKDTYNIIHIYGKKAQSFIKKNGKELNENGGVRTFNEIVFNEFGISSDYFKIGKIGSNTSSFIDYTAAERKVFISKFLPHIEDYLEKFSVVKDKFKVISNDIKTVSADIEKLQEEEKLKQELSTVIVLKDSISKDIEEYAGKVAVLKSDIERLTEETKIDISQLSIQLNEKLKKKEEIKNNGRNFLIKYGKNIQIQELEKIIEEKTNELHSIESEILVLLNKKQTLSSLIVDCENNILKKNAQKKEYQTFESTEKLKEEKKNIEEEIKELNVSNNYFFNEASKDIQNFLSYIEKFKIFFDFICLHFSELNNKDLNSKERNIEIFLSEEAEGLLERIKQVSKRNIEEKNTLLNNKREIYNRKISNISKLSILEKRPELCKIDSCPFISDALQYKNLPEELKELELEIASIEKDIKELEVRAESIENLNILYKQFSVNFSLLNPRQNSVFINLLKKEVNIQSFLLNNFTTFSRKYNEELEIANEAVNLFNSLKNLESSLLLIKNKIEISENNEKISKSIEEEIEKFKINKDEYKKKYTEIEEEINSLKNKKESLVEIINDHSMLLEGKKEFNSLSTQISNLNSEIEEARMKFSILDEKKQEFTKSDITLKSLKNRKSENEELFIKIQNELNKIKELKERKKSLEDNFNEIRLIKDSLDPNKGIPLFFIKSYLEKTKDIANNLLNIAFNGKFEIDFQTSPTEFFIKVRSGENIKNDIREASQGEISLTKISISFALIEQSLGKFNVLALDEIDGALDSDNRKNFIEILEKQAEKLKIEQIFVISHNDVFDICSSNLILLDGNSINTEDEEFMKNKEIIFKS